MSIEHDITQSLKTWEPRWPTDPREEETFATYLRRHHLNILQAAHAAAVPLALVWRAAHSLPITEQKARNLVAALARSTGERFAGVLLVIQRTTRTRATRFLVEDR